MKCQDTIADFWSALVDAQGEKIVGSRFFQVAGKEEKPEDSRDQGGLRMVAG
jgi:hypothetical protein